jgi:hypothetical protein
MHAPIYRCRFNCSGICSPEEFAVDTLTNFWTAWPQRSLPTKAECLFLAGA